MLASLFGDLSALKQHRRAVAAGQPDFAEEADAGFAATTIMDEPAAGAGFSIHARVDDPHAQNLFVTGSPALAIREHFRKTRDDLGQTNQMITLLDVSRTRAAPLLKALSDATGAPIERLHLREQATLRTMAVIERTTVQRRDRDTLKIYFADTRDSGSEEAEVRAALMERSQLTAVLLDDITPTLLDDTLSGLAAAVRHSTWRCPMLAFLLPPNSSALASRIRSMPWPTHVHVDLSTEPLRGASALWNMLLTLWERRRDEPAPVEFPRIAHSGADGLDPGLTGRLLVQLLNAEGVHGCALVDAAAGALLAGETSLPAGLAPDLSRAALACSLTLRAQQHAARTMGWAAGRGIHRVGRRPSNTSSARWRRGRACSCSHCSTGSGPTWPSPGSS